MGVELMGFEVVPAPVGAVDEVDKPSSHEKEIGKLEQDLGHNEPIEFGSHVDEPVEGEEDNVSNANFPKDAVEEWPAPKQIHSFYFVRYRTYDDPKLSAKIDHADKEVQRKIQERFQIIEKLKANRADKAELNAQLFSLRTERKEYNTILDEKKKEMEPLQLALGKLRNTNSGGLCSSEEELNNLIQSFQYRIQHESIPLSEEKQLLREIKQLEGTREKVIANAAIRSKLQNSLGQKDVIQDQVKHMGVDFDGVRKERQAVSAKISLLDDKWKAIDKEISSLQKELEVVTDKRNKAIEIIQELRKNRDEGNANFYHSRTVLFKARELAAHKKIKGLEELSHAEVEKFMSLWNGKKAFRDDYEKRILASLDGRQLSRDGRIRNPDEKPLVVPEAPLPSETETLPKASVKRSKEDSKTSPQQDSSLTQKVQKEASKRVKDSKFTSEHGDIAVKEISGLGKLQTDLSPAKKEIDVEKLKEMKREEELAKAKISMERKKKLAEKAAAKAAIRAEKETEKKLKEREKKAKKKAAGNLPPTDLEETTETAAEVSETEKVDGDVEAPAPVKEKVQKERTVRYRSRAKGPDVLPRAILKRKKGTNYWLWAAPIALVVLMLLVLTYFFVL